MSALLFPFMSPGGGEETFKIAPFVVEVKGVETDAVGCAWVNVDVDVRVEGEVTTACSARIAIPSTPDENPWAREGDQWQP